MFLIFGCRFPVGLRRLLLSECGIQLAVSTVKAARKRLGWKKTGPKYCQVIREANRIAQLAFCERCVEIGNTFDDVIFTDESSVWIERHGRLCFRKEGMPAKLKPKVKHPYKVHVWAGISKRGATSILIFTGIMRAEFYVDSILRDTLLPFFRQTFPDGYRFQQDNDPKHKSKKSNKWIGLNFSRLMSFRNLSIFFPRKLHFVDIHYLSHKLSIYLLTMY